MKSEAPTAVDELQMRAFWRRWNELLTGEPAQPEGPRYDTSYLVSGLASAEAS
jgi:hypothetical protein